MSNDPTLLENENFQSVLESCGDIVAVESIDDLLRFKGARFIICCYLSVLGRLPDEAGFKSYLALLQEGADRFVIAGDMAISAEGRSANRRVSGLSGPLPAEHLNSSGMVSVRYQADKPRTEASMIPSGVGARIFGAIKALGGLRDTTTEFRTLWVDLTTSFEWVGSVVGIIRAELEIARGLKAIDPSVRFSMQVGHGFVEIDIEQLRWLLDSDNVVDAYMAFFNRYKTEQGSANNITVTAPDTPQFFYPFGKNDLIISVGWMDSQKETYFSKLKLSDPSIFIAYLIYDMILALDSTAHFYPKDDCDRFRQYVKWICHNADFVLYGGQTAKNDTENFLNSENWPVPPGRVIQFGTDIATSVVGVGEDALLSEIGVSGPFMITVGSIEPRKNHDTLYRAYLLALELCPEGVPQLIICGKPVSRVGNLLDSLDRDPRLKGRVIVVSPTDSQLAALYKRCLFTLLPSVYEGWSLTLPESLGRGKFCLAADTPPLREIGREMADFIAPYDVRSWAQKIMQYSKDLPLLKLKEETIRKKWPMTHWSDTARMIYSAASELIHAKTPQQGNLTNSSERIAVRKPTVWMDLTLTFLQWPGHVTGIIRAELTIAFYLHRLAPETRFFAYDDGNFFEIKEHFLHWLFNATDLTSAYDAFQKYWSVYETQGTGYRNPFRQSKGPAELNPSYLFEIPENAIVFFAAIDMDGTGQVHRTKDILQLIYAEKRVMTSHLIYDFTPVLFPHLHAAWTCVGYEPFTKFISNNFDHIVYGGQTARRDGLKIQNEKGWKSPQSDFLEFGSNLLLLPTQRQSTDETSDNKALVSLGITGAFVMTVGTIEPRKNHDMLYKAYLRLVERDALVEPLQMIFVGKPGWKTEDFRELIAGDLRVKDKILFLNPSDDELELLYRKCKFTLLPSFYEGWSLTLPESLGYGKFCLVSDVDPLKETGRDLVEYIHPLDTYMWAERIEFYANNEAEVAIWEARILENWQPTDWHKSTETLLDALYRAHGLKFLSREALKHTAANNG